MELLTRICLGLICVMIGAVIQAITTKERSHIMPADIASLLALARENNEIAKKVKAEVIAMRDALNTRVTTLEGQIAELTITPEQKDALLAELTGAREELSQMDALNDDAASA